MFWLRRTGAAVAVALLVVLSPAAASAAFALQPPPPPVDPYPVLPSTAVKTGAGVMDGTKSWAQAYAEVQRDVVKTGKPVAPPLTQAGKVLRGANLSIKGNVIIDGFTIGFTLGSLGVRGIYQLAGVDSFDSSVCGDPIQGAAGFLYPDLMPDCTASYVESELNVDVTAIPPGWTFSPVFSGSSTNPKANWQVSLDYSSSRTGSGPWTLGVKGATAYQGESSTGCWLGVMTGRASLYGLTASGAWQQLGSGIGVDGCVDGTISGGSNWSPKQGQSLSRAVSGSSPYIALRLQYSGPDGTLNTPDDGFWYSETAPNRPAGRSGDPLRTAKCKVTMKDGSVREGFIGQYRESEGFPVGAISAACEDASGNPVAQGLLPDTIEITSTNPDTGQTDTISTTKVPDFTESEKVGLTPGDNTGLRLLKVVNGVVQSCMTWEADCASWWPKTQQGTVADTDEGTYRCEYGGRAVSLNECGVYRETFDAKTDKPTVTDPVSGGRTDWSSSAKGNNSTSPGGAGDVSPGSQCMSEWSAAPNPIEWVFHPVKCAFVWAFVPRDSQVKATVAAVGTAAGDVALVQPLLALVDQLPNSSGCEGIPFELTFFGTAFHGRILDACEGETRAVATVVNGLLSLVVITGAVIAITRYAAAVFGFVGPGGAIEQTSRQTERVIQRTGKGSD